MKAIMAVIISMVMLLTGCGCANDTNDDGIIGNDNVKDDVNDDMDISGDGDDVIENDMGMGDDILGDMDATDGTLSGRSRMSNASSGIGTAVDGVGNAIEDVGKGANRVMHDVGNAMK